ncbi:hypothetical protein [Candidatus Solirubrobacter pratensis]|uniref:hypothetical protein n=1 Tax=Candidatus Solirubrobacter pratensis TaxID=1298857 RepID=UPI0012DE8370|nr:hypothetical protein [Candidatus Solirubrobacter pratensis]
MTTRLLLAACAATASLAVAACGGEKPTSSGAQDGTQAKAKKAMLDYAKCMRDHGVDMADPQFDANGRGTVRMTEGKGTDPEKARAAETACRHFQDEVKPPAMSEEQQADMRKRALANSKCMRDHGFNMPDPQFDDSGRMTMRIDKSSGIDPNDPKFQEAAKACQKESGMGVPIGGKSQ